MSKILIVQDSKSIAAIIKSLLEAENFSVLVAETGEDALKKIQAEDFNLILLDYGLPGMDGGQVCRFLKQDDKFKSIPVIFMSAKRDSEMEKIVTEYGAQGFMGEEFELEALINTVNRYLKKDQVDKKQAAGELGIPEELYNNIFEVFLQETTESIAKIDGLRISEDFEGLRQAAHSIKGSAGNLRISEVHAAAKEIEYFNHENSELQVLDNFILRLKRAFETLKKEA